MPARSARVRAFVMIKSRPRAGAIRSPNQCAESGSRALYKVQTLRCAMLPRSVVAVVPLASHFACSGWALLAFMSASVITSATFRRDGFPLHSVLAPSRPRYASPPQFKAHYLATLAPRFEPATFPALHCPSLHRLRTLRSTSHLSALRTSSRGHGLADVGLRSRLRHRSTRHSFDASLPSPRTFKRTLERLDVAPHARQNRQARHKRIKPPFPPPRGIPLSHALAGWSAGRLPPLQVQQCVSIRSWGQGLDA